MKQKDNIPSWVYTICGALLGSEVVVFILLKLDGYLTWSWWKVFSPFWVFAIFQVSFGIIRLGVFIRRFLDRRDDIY